MVFSELTTKKFKDFLCKFLNYIFKVSSVVRFHSFLIIASIYKFLKFYGPFIVQNMRGHYEGWIKGVEVVGWMLWL